MQRMFRIVGIVALFGGLLAFAPRPAGAQPAPALSNVPAIALKQGQSVEQTLGGVNLGGVASASVADARGLSVALVKPDKPNDGEVRLKLAAAADAPVGDRELRLISPLGVTRPVRVFVSAYDVVAEREPNNQPAEAQEIKLPATIVGRMDGAGDVDCFRFDATKGQRLIFDVRAARAGSPLDPVVTIHRPTGRELRPVIERHGGDPVLVFDVPEDGSYVLRVRDLQYRGGGDYDYQINAGHIPYLESVLPSSGRPGEIVHARALGHNLDGGGEQVTVDLTMTAPGRIEVAAQTPLGPSNLVPFEVTELPQLVEQEPNDKPEQANLVSLPAEVSGHMDAPADEDFYRFHVPYRQPVSLEVLAGRFGSPMTPLLQLRDAKGNVIESNDGAQEADARIVRELDAGDYLASVRDLAYAGGPGFWYRLKLERARSVPEDFAVRFIPEAPRVHRGGNVAVWCEVRRFNGFHGEVTIAPEGLPAGVTAQPIVLPEDTSGWFTLAAAPDAALGTAPIHLRATAMVGATTIAHEAEPELDGRAVREAFVTVLEPAPFAVEAVAAMTPQRIEQLGGEVRALADKLNAPDPRFDAALAEWEHKAAARPRWSVLTPMSVAAANGTNLQVEPDGSVLATGTFPAQDRYTLTGYSELRGITAVRLEVLTDDRLPARGPGAAPNGNFVLSEFRVSATPEAEPAQAVTFKRATADFAQDGFPVAAAIDNNPGTGWAIQPQAGRPHTAVFEAAAPFATEPGAVLTFVLDHQSIYAQHSIGRFRLSVTTADPAALAAEADVPSAIVQILDVPREARSAEQRNALIEYFRTIDPQTAAERARLEALRTLIAPYAEIDRLEKALGASTPQLEAEQGKWEQSLASGAGWWPLDVSDLRSSGGSQLHKEPDGSIFVDGANPPSDTYTLSTAVPFKGISAIRIEALPDPRLAGNGPGRAGDGNFVLSRLRLSASPAKPSATTRPADRDVALASARATVEQDGFAVAGALDDKDETGWAIGPANAGRPAAATFDLKEPLADADSALAITLEHLSKQPQHGLGHFQVWATASREPDAAVRPPVRVAVILRTPAGSRSEAQKQQLAGYFRSIAPSLDPVRQRLADLQSSVPAMPLKVARNRAAVIPVPLNRAANFKGDIQVSLIGFTARRDGDRPGSIARDLKLTPMVVNGDNMFGTLALEAEGGAETGTRMVVLKAEAKVGNDTVTEYSPAFPLTIEK